MTDDQIASIVQRIQRLTAERKEIAEDIASVYAEAKANGFDKAAIKWVVSELEKPHAERQERDAIRELYMRAVVNSAPAPARAIASGVPDVIERYVSDRNRADTLARAGF